MSHTRESLALRIEDARRWGLRTQERYEAIVEEMATLRLYKVREYGEARFDASKDGDITSIEESKALLWANLQRKVQRAKNDLIATPSQKPKRDTYLDLANYALMVLEVGEEEGWL